MMSAMEADFETEVEYPAPPNAMENTLPDMMKNKPPDIDENMPPDSPKTRTSDTVTPINVNPTATPEEDIITVPISILCAKGPVAPQITQTALTMGNQDTSLPSAEPNAVIQAKKTPQSSLTIKVEPVDEVQDDTSIDGDNHWNPEHSIKQEIEEVQVVDENSSSSICDSPEPCRSFELYCPSNSEDFDMTQEEGSVDPLACDIKIEHVVKLEPGIDQEMDTSEWSYDKTSESVEAEKDSGDSAKERDRSFKRGPGSQSVTPTCDQSLQRKFVCVHCLKEFKQRRDLLLHNNTHHMDYRHVCVLCWTTYKTHESLIIHNYRCHSNLNDYLFDSLNKTDIKLNSQNNTYHCDKCLYQTNSQHILSLHIKTHSDRKLPNEPNSSGHPVTQPRRKSSDSEEVNSSPNPDVILKKKKLVKCSAKPKNKAKVTSQMSTDNPRVKNRKKRSRKGHKGQRIGYKGKSKRKHFENDLLECPFCNYWSWNLWMLKRHVMIHTGEKPLKCAHCAYASIWHGNLAKHVKSHHSAAADDKPIKAVNTRQSDVRKTRGNLRSSKEPTGCPHCSFRTANKLLFTRHLSMHGAIKGSSTNRTMRQNVPKPKTAHWNIRSGSEKLDVNENLNKSLVCAQCKPQTSREDILTEQKINVDSEENAYKCNRCIDGLSNDAEMHLKMNKNEIASKSSKMIQVNAQCKSQTSSEDILAEQKINVDSEENAYKCIDGPSNKTQLEINISEKIVSKPSQKIQVNGDSQPKLLGRKKRKYSEKKFACPQCSFRAPWKSRLDQHMVMHSDRKPFKCGQCSYMSFWSYNLTNHKFNKHPTGNVKTLEVSLYACSNCNFQTRFRSHFTQHMLNSTVVKSYRCCRCDHKFAKLNNLIFHMRKLHETEQIQANNVCCYNSQKCLVKKSFACLLCKYETEFRYRLARHLIIHSRKVLHKCSRCSYATFQKDDFNEHVQQKHSQKQILPKENELTERSLKVIQKEKNNSENKPLIGCSRKKIFKKCQPNTKKSALV